MGPFRREIREPSDRLHCLFLSWKIDHFVLIVIDTYSGCGFAFPAYSASAKAITSELRKCLIHHHYIPHNISSHQGVHFRANEMWQWATSNHPEVASLIEWWDSLLKTQLKGQHLARLG